MAERAKLRYKDLSFYDEDLKKLCTYVCQASGLQFVDYKIERETETVWYQYRNHTDVEVDCISFEELSQLRVPLIKEKPIIVYDFMGKHYEYYRKDIWELEDLLSKYFKLYVKNNKLDNYGKNLYIYFNVKGDKFIGVGFDNINVLKDCIKAGMNYRDIKLKARTWGNLD